MSDSEERIRLSRMKERAYLLASGHLRAICEDKEREQLSPEDREVWDHVRLTIVTGLERKAELVRDRRGRRINAGLAL